MDPPTNEKAQNPEENVEKGIVNHEVLGTQEHISRWEVIPVVMEAGGSKHHHVYQILDSD